MGDIIYLIIDSKLLLVHSYIGDQNSVLADKNVSVLVLKMRKKKKVTLLFVWNTPLGIEPLSLF